MTITFQPPPQLPSPADLAQARRRQELLCTELPRVRAAALAWRNGLAGLLAGLVGFGLVKGRSNLSDLSHPWAVTVGMLLLASLTAGVLGALWLMTAAHGLPRIVGSQLASRGAADHEEAVLSASRLSKGIRATLICTATLVAAVAVTWYGPTAAAPGIHVTTPTGVLCGSAVVNGPQGTILTTAHGDVQLPLSEIATAMAGPPCS